MGYLFKISGVKKCEGFLPVNLSRICYSIRFERDARYPGTQGSLIQSEKMVNPGSMVKMRMGGIVPPVGRHTTGSGGVNQSIKGRLYDKRHFIAPIYGKIIQGESIHTAKGKKINDAPRLRFGNRRRCARKTRIFRPGFPDGIVPADDTSDNDDDSEDKNKKVKNQNKKDNEGEN